jgi:hypothetical protein
MRRAIARALAMVGAAFLLMAWQTGDHGLAWLSLSFITGAMVLAAVERERVAVVLPAADGSDFVCGNCSRLRPPGTPCVCGRRAW